jgi:hypothetical protein
MKNLKKHILLFLFAIPLFSYSQIADSTLNMWLFEANYSLQYPDGDIAERYGINSTIGFGITYKTKSNWTLGIEANYLFGSHIKDGSSVLDGLKTESGQIINRYGEYATIALSQRGLFTGVKLGKIIPVLSPNKNSGIMINITGGWLHHKIKIENKDNNAPPVLDDYKKGYDRLTGGFALREFIGYKYLGNNEMVNFYFGFEFFQAKTKSLRAFNFDTMEADKNTYTDFLYSFRVGWILPVYRKAPEKYYYF